MLLRSYRTIPGRRQGIEKPLAYLLKGRMAEKDVDKLDANKTQTERKQFPAHGSRRCKARFWLR
jgi:hypothetical protein